MSTQVEATNAKAAFIESLGGWQSTRQYGIVAMGLSRDGADWYIAVRTNTRDKSPAIPDEYNGVPLKCAYVGEIRPL